MINTLALLGSWFAGLVGFAALPSVASASVVSLVEAPAAEAFVADGASALQQGPPVRVWLEEGTDLFYPGDPVRLRFRTEEDAYVAVLHLDTEGNIDLLYPRTSFDQAFVRGRRTHSLPARMDRLALGRAPGIGYFYVVASPYPLDFRALNARAGLGGTYGAWEAWSAGIRSGRSSR